MTVNISAVDALSTRNGSVLWQHAQADVANPYNTAVYNDILYLASEGQLAAIRVSDGKQLWTRSALYSAEPNAGNGVIYTKGERSFVL